MFLLLVPSLCKSRCTPARLQTIISRCRILRDHLCLMYVTPRAFPNFITAATASSKVLYTRSGGGRWSRDWKETSWRRERSIPSGGISCKLPCTRRRGLYFEGLVALFRSSSVRTGAGSTDSAGSAGSIGSGISVGSAGSAGSAEGRSDCPPDCCSGSSVSERFSNSVASESALEYGVSAIGYGDGSWLVG